MTTADAKDYILQHLATLKLTDRRVAELDADLDKWKSRLALAQEKGLEDLAAAARKELDARRAERDRIAAEAEDLRGQIERMRRQLPTLGSRERSVDPDLLEQELLMAAGALPGDDDKVQVERDLRKLEKTQAAESDLAALKTKLAAEGAPQKGPDKP